MIKRTSLKRTLSFMLPMLLLLALAGPVQAQEPVQTHVPDFFNFDDNYYTVYGYPEVTASLVGDNEFSRGDTVTLDINLMNKGIITGFESDEDIDAGDKLDQKLQKTEMEYESQRTTAIGIVANMASLDPMIKVKSGPQEAGSLRTGEQTENPIQFTIEVAKDASAGTYPLVLSLIYGYQENVQVTGDDETDLGITNMEVGIWYEARTQNITIPIKVEKEADFKVTNVTGQLTAGEEGIIHVTYENTGEMPVKDATVRISVADPFSTTDDQAFLGSFSPGETAVAIFKIKTDETATPKSYGITSEIKYEDMDGHDRTSDTMKIGVETSQNESSSGTYMAIAGIIAVAILGLVAYTGYNRFLKK